MKKVSVILTTYNSELSLQRTLDSIFHQQGFGNLFQIELLVIDDCSTDTTRNILEKNNIIYRTTNANSGGPNRGRNIGLELASGDYILITDHDDEWKANRIISLLPPLESSPIVSSGYTLVDNNTGKIYERVNTPPSSGPPVLFFPENETFQNKLQKSHSGQQAYMGSIIFHRELRHILFEEKYGVVDYDWLLRLYHNRSSAEVCQSLYYRHVTKVNLSLNESYRLKDYNYSLDIIKNYESAYPRLVRVGRKRINGTLARYYYSIGKMKKSRYYLRRSGLYAKTFLYYITTFIGSSFVRKKFKVFG